MHQRVGKALRHGLGADTALAGGRWPELELGSDRDTHEGSRSAARASAGRRGSLPLRDALDSEVRAQRQELRGRRQLSPLRTDAAGRATPASRLGPRRPKGLV